MRDQLVQSQQFLVGFVNRRPSVPAFTPDPAFNASVASRRTGSYIASPAISHSVMKRSTAVGKLTRKTPQLLVVRCGLKSRLNGSLESVRAQQHQAYSTSPADSPCPTPMSTSCFSR